MTMGGNEAQPVRLIAVDSEGIPVTDPQILQAAAEQAGIMFVSKDENDEENSITIDQAMQVNPTPPIFFSFIYINFRFQTQIINRMINMIKMILIHIKMEANNVTNMTISHVTKIFHFEIIFQMKINKCKMEFIPK